MMMEKISHFLLVFDHQAGKLVREENFGHDGVRALAAYTACEQHYRDNRLVEIVLIGSDSIETVRLTHANYYDGSVALSQYLVGI